MTGTYQRAVGPTVLAVIVVLVALTVIAVPAAGSQVIGTPDFDAHATDDILIPGEEKELEIVLNNRGDLTNEGPANLEDMVRTAYATTVEIDDEDEPITVQTNEHVIGNVPLGHTEPIPFRAIADEDAEPGEYEVTVRVEYRDVWQARQVREDVIERTERTRTERVDLEIEISERARFEVMEVNANTTIGEPGTLSATIQNVGEETAHETTITAEAPDPDITFPRESVADTHPGEWEPGENRTFSFGVNVGGDAEPRPYRVEFTPEFRDDDGFNEVARPVSGQFDPAAEQTFLVDDIESTLEVGWDGELSLSVENAGPNDIEDAVVILEDDVLGQDPSPGTIFDRNVVPRDSQSAIGTLGVGESATVDFRTAIRHDADPGLRNIDATVRYRNADDDRVVSERLDVPVEVEPERDEFDVEVIEESVPAGYDGPITVAITNTGGQPMTDIEGKLFTNDPLDSEDDQSYAGDLEPGESTEVIFNLQVEEDAQEKAYAPTVDFRYDDEWGDSTLSDSYRAPIEVTQPADLPVVPIVILVLLVVTGALLYWRSKRVRRAIDEVDVLPGTGETQNED